MSSIDFGDLVMFRWPKDDSKTWTEYVGLVSNEGRFIHGNRHIAIIRYDGIWYVPYSWCVKING